MSQITPNRQETFGQKVLGVIILILVCIFVMGLAALVFDPIGGNAGNRGCESSCQDDQHPAAVDEGRFP